MISFSKNTLKLLPIFLVLVLFTSSCKSQKSVVSKIEFRPVSFAEDCKKTGSSLKYNLPIVETSNENSKNLEIIIVRKLLDNDVFLFLNDENIGEIENKSLSNIIYKELGLAKVNCNSDDALSTSIEVNHKIKLNNDGIISLQFSIVTIQSNFEKFDININYDINNQQELQLLDIINEEGVNWILKESNLRIENIFEDFISDYKIPEDDREEVKNQSTEFDYKLSEESIKASSFSLEKLEGVKGLRLDYDFPFDNRYVNMLEKPNLFFSFEELKTFLIKSEQ
ncbi:hypothetical protein [Aquimarina sp. SS2-1]|uniref:hypothetical protein n=1 Tax=Aquimarina besae TaxID=3342247 RepID=UPI003671CA34